MRRRLLKQCNSSSICLFCATRLNIPVISSTVPGSETRENPVRRFRTAARRQRSGSAAAAAAVADIFGEAEDSLRHSAAAAEQRIQAEQQSVQERDRRRGFSTGGGLRFESDVKGNFTPRQHELSPHLKHGASTDHPRHRVDRQFPRTGKHWIQRYGNAHADSRTTVPPNQAARGHTTQLQGQSLAGQSEYKGLEELFARRRASQPPRPSFKSVPSNSVPKLSAQPLEDLPKHRDQEGSRAEEQEKAPPTWQHVRIRRTYGQDGGGRDEAGTERADGLTADDRSGSLDVEVTRPAAPPREPTPNKEQDDRLRKAHDRQFVGFSDNASPGQLDGSGQDHDARKPGEPLHADPYDRRRARRLGRLGASAPSGRSTQRQKGQQRLRLIENEDAALGDRNIDYDDIAEKQRSKKARKAERERAKAAAAPPTPIILPDFISLGNLASVLHVRSESFMYKLKTMGFEELTNDHVLDAETAGLIAVEFNFEPVTAEPEVQDLVAQPPPDDTALLVPRPPIVTIMGHVDHGKTTLLDWLRNSSIVAGEHGGITQHIGAFTVTMPSGRVITFLDTPGHAAFLSMRARGANVTDIVVLVVAADDSVKPQTIEAIKHARTAKVPIIVAINKVDKEGADIERVKRDLTKHDVVVEDFGGDVQAVCVSGKTGQGMEDLEETVITLADVLDMRADETGQAEGWVVEATTKKAGRVATVLVRRGTVVPGTVLVAGTTWTRVRTLKDENGAILTSATPGMPVEIDGWREQPEAGAEVLQAPTESRARDVVEARADRLELDRLATDMTAVNETRRAADLKREQEAAELNRPAPEAASTSPREDSASTKPSIINVPVVLRADVSGSVEALQASILSIGNNEIYPTLLKSAVGQLSPSDIEHAATAGGLAISFNQPIPPEIARQAELSRVNIIDGNVIYRVVDEIRQVLEEKLPPVVTSRVTGEAEIGQIFNIKIKGSRTMPIAGVKVQNGVVTKSSKVRVLRSGKRVYEGTINSLKNVKKDVTEMRKGTECGMGFEEFSTFEIGDQIQCYEEISERRRL